MRSASRSALYTVLLTVLPATFLHAQELAFLTPPTDHTAETSTRPTTGTARVPNSISDDGNNQERVPTTTQLVVAYTGEADITFTLDILNEHGHVVRHQVLDPSRNQRFWTVDVERLRTGRYVARLLCAKGAVINRFRRD